MNLSPKTPDNQEIPEETLESRLTHLAEMKAEYQQKRKAFKNQNKHLLESIKSLENIITSEVLQLGKTVTVGNIRAEYIPHVTIRIKKDKNDEQ